MIVVMMMALVGCDQDRGAREEVGTVERDAVGRTETREDVGVATTAERGEEQVASYDARFVDVLIAYNDFTKDLVDVGARKAQRDELETFAENAAKGHDTKVSQLKNWRDTWFGQAKPETGDFDDALALLPGAPAYEFGVAWQSVSVATERPEGTEPSHPSVVTGVQTTTGVAAWDSDRVIESLKEVPDEQFDRYFTDTLAAHHKFGTEVAQAAMPQLQRPELRNVAQEMIATNTAHVKQLQDWKNAWFGSTPAPRAHVPGVPPRTEGIETDRDVRDVEPIDRDMPAPDRDDTMNQPLDGTSRPIEPVK